MDESVRRQTKDGHPFCFRCKYFYRGKGEKYASAHCSFDFYNTCDGRLQAVYMGKEYEREG